jgi:hypothetical protein
MKLNKSERPKERDYDVTRQKTIATAQKILDLSSYYA